MSNVRQTITILLILVGMAAAFWWPTLVDGKSLIHGDAIVHGLPLMDLHARVLHEGASVLWSEQIFGGHPLFAESQGAFAHPLNLLLAWLVPPVYGHNLFHFLCMVLAGFGTFGLCRELGASRWSAGFAAIALTFSTAWTAAHHNMSISGALTWTPWVCWAFERWLRQPTIRHAALLGLSGALVILAGYPQAFHGVVIYVLTTLMVIPLQKAGRTLLSIQWRKLAITSSIAVLFCVGLAAVQLLPLVELVSLSHRSGGIKILFSTFPDAYFRGFLFTFLQTDVPPLDYFPVAGSLLLCILASLAFVVKTPARIKGHMLAVVLLGSLGMGHASSIFNFIYDRHLLPGLHSFRGMQLYLDIAIIGIAILAAFAIDGLIHHVRQNPKSWWRSAAVLATVAVLGCGWGAIVYHLYLPIVPWQNLATVAIVLLGIFALAAMKRANLIAPLIFLVFAGECASLRLHPFIFGDSASLRRPAVLQEISRSQNSTDYKFLNSSIANGYGFLNPRQPGLENHMQRMLSSVSELTNLLWNQSSLNGALALQTSQRAMLDPLIKDEINGRAATPPGQRAIDLLGVRYIAVDNPLASPAFRVGFHDIPFSMWIMENTAALPRFQTFTRHIAVQSAEEALALLKKPRDSALIVQRVDGVSMPISQDAANNPAAISFQIREAKSKHYVVDVEASQPGWLFLADANYPGWQASVDGVPSEVYSAQILGKAVAVPTGKHRVELYFVSTTFRVGLALSLFTLIAMIGILASTGWAYSHKKLVQPT